MTQPIRIEIDLPLTSAEAFSVYAERIGDWWPAAFTSSGDDLDSVAIESWAGGHVYERSRDGATYQWGVVRSYEAGVELVHSFHLAQDEQHPTEVSVRFTDEGGCRMHFEHRGWTAHNQHARDKFASEGGWATVLGAFAARARNSRHGGADGLGL
ncbi:MAG: SRPBCC domain-containing protein [Nocardioidaceae bacterium]